MFSYSPHFPQLLLSWRISQEFHFHSTEGEVSWESSICWLWSQLCFQVLSWDKDTEKNLVALHGWTSPREALVVLTKRFMLWPSVFVGCKGSSEHRLLLNICGWWKPRECLETVQGSVMSARSGLILSGKSLLDLLRRRDVDLGCKFENHFSAVL